MTKKMMNLKFRFIAALILAGCSHGSFDGNTAGDEAAPNADPKPRPGDRQQPSEDQSLLDRDVGAPIQTDRLSYTVVSEGESLRARIGYVFANPLAAAVRIINCNEVIAVSLEKQVGAEWVYAWGPVLQTCISPPIVIEPGGSHANVVELHAFRRSRRNVRPHFMVNSVPRVYRLVVDDVVRAHGKETSSADDRLPLEQRISNRFYLDVEQ